MFAKILQPSMAVPFPAQTSNLRVWMFLPVFAITCLASLAYVFARPAVYLSTARLQIEAAPSSARLQTEAASSGGRPQTGAAPSQRQTEERDTSPQLPAEVQTLTSGTLLDQVGERLSRSNIRAAGEVNSADSLQGMLSAVPVAGTNVIELRAEGSNREQLPQALSAWIEIYRERHSNSYDQSSELAFDETRSVDEQLQQKLTAKRQALDQFRKKYDIVSLEREDNQAMAQLKGLNSALNDARNREINAEARFNAMRDNVAAGKGVQLPGDKTNIHNLEQRATDLRDKMKDLESEYGLKFLQMDPNYKAMRANLTRLEQQIEQERQAGSQQALQGAEEELVSARQTVLRLQKDLAGRKREAQEFTTRFAEHTALVNELRQLEGSADAGRQRLTQLEMGKSLAGPKVTILTQPSVPERPLRPDYWRDALLGVVGSAVLGLIAVWFVEFFKRSGVPRLEPATQPIIHINYPPSPMLEVAVPTFGAPALQLTESIARLPREISGPEVHALWAAASPDTRLVIAALLGGLSIDELAALRYEDIDFDADRVRVSAASDRSYSLREPLRHLLSERQAAGGAAPLTYTRGAALSSADLEGLITCAACDAGLANPAEVTSEVLRHTYVAYLVRQGVRLADLGDIIGHVAPAAFREYGRLSPPGPGLPLGQIDPVFPALRRLNG
jgi:succinoglycan biosynthesis transport protein ExoP